MRKAILLTLLVAVVALPAFAELQNIEVGGSIRIRGNWYSSEAGADTGLRVANPLVSWPWAPVIANGFRWNAGLLPGRPIGARIGAGTSSHSWDDVGNNNADVEQRTRLNVKADFTDAVSAFIELDSYDQWGEALEFRSNYITGVDRRANTGDDVEVYQAYIEANEMWGQPLRVRIGRQELSLGSEWLVGVNDASSAFRGLSFDAIRATYATDMFSVDAFWAKLVERSPIEEDGDVDLYGVYASYLGLEDITIDGYWLMVRDGRMLFDTPYAFPGIQGAIEHWFGVDDYDPTYLHTVGLRGAGTVGAFDFEAELAYQFGDADAIGWFFIPKAYGDDDADFDEIGLNLEVGYTFDMTYRPRVFLGFAYLGGEDERDITFWDWVMFLYNPFYSPNASVSFNRLFSNWEYSEFLDATELSNVWIARGGVSASPTEKVELTLLASYFEAIDEFDVPPHFFLLGRRFLIAPFVPFMGLAPWWTRSNDSDLGWELELIAKYNYTEDLSFEAGWAHLFAGDGLGDGNFVNSNGLAFNGGRDDDDADYLYFETKICF